METLASFPSSVGVLDWKTGLHARWCIWVSTKYQTLWTPKGIYSKTPVASPPGDRVLETTLMALASACSCPQTVTIKI